MSIILIVLFDILSKVVSEEVTLNDYSDYNTSEFFSTTEYNNISENYSDYCNTSSCFEKTTNAPTVSQTKPPKISINYTYGFCLCNLQINICDLNCCCDEDCSYDDKKIFDHCKPVQKAKIDRRECQYIYYGYENYTMQKWNIYNNDLFCIVRRNLPHTQTIPNKQVFETFFEASLEKDDKYDWPGDSPTIIDFENWFQPYTQGDPVRVILNNFTWSYFKVPQSFISGGCNIETQVSYLNNIENKCTQKLEMKNSFVNVDYLRKLIFIGKPALFNYTKFRDQLQTCSSPICVKVNTEICATKMLLDCRPLNDSDIQFICRKSEKIVKCERVIDSLKFTIYHKGVDGIERIRLSVHLTDVVYDISLKEFTIRQHIDVEYRWVQDPKNYSQLLSGNPGYLVGKPILFGTRLNNTIVRNSSLYYENFMVLPYEDLGVCLIGENHYQPIEFGYDIFLICKIRGHIIIPANTKIDRVCKNLQLEIFKYWRILATEKGFVNRTFGQYGNANVTVLNTWKDILYEKPPEQILTNINGTLRNETRSLTCNGLVFGLNMDIYHARVDSKNLLDQEKILGITYQFNQYRNVSFSLNTNQLEFSYEMNIVTKIKFWDITRPKLVKLVDSPSLNIKFPSDFFYPFVKVDNSVSKILCLSETILSLLCVLIIMCS